MSEVKRIIALVVIPGDTSQCVRNESYLLRSRSLASCAGHHQRFFIDLAFTGHLTPALAKLACTSIWPEMVRVMSFWSSHGSRLGTHEWGCRKYCVHKSSSRLPA
jgi:hypothetical protein